MNKRFKSEWYGPDQFLPENKMILNYIFVL